ncbi:conjugal transfer protein (plasmid) [Bacillus methanolicus]|uniref:CD3337/EF1877 family mobilome membrane protein n=1 Tax=Bacillus methanolicus TaxID=1471 RepID=UPI00237FDCFF|nr:conjugal transfer protein [Bacillus methanolicus]MDE3841081.1 conjugal transfer protein [Bacillus methanolicus]
MKKLVRLFLLSIALLLVFQLSASAESIQDNLVPQDSDQKSVGEVELKYNEYPQHHYKLDTYVDTSGDWMPWNWADGSGKQIYIALMEIINSVWNVNVLLANFTMKIVQEAFELDFVSDVVDQIGQAVQNIAGFGPGGFMSNGLWPLLVTFVIGIIGAWATYVGMVKRETSRAWSGLLSSIIIFVFALGFFSNASTILKGINDWSSDIQSDMLAVSASIVNPGASYTQEEGIATIRNQMFDLMVKKPYLLMQYGTTEVDKGRVNTILSVDPILDAEKRQEEAQKEVEEKDNSMMSIDGISQRAGFVPLLFLANTIIGVFLLIISGTIILYQMIFLALVLFAPVPLLIALVPRWQQTAFDWAMKVLHAQLMKIAIALLLTILFGISAILYRATDNGDLGYLGMMLLQIICFVGIWAKRKELFNMVSTAVNNVQSSTGATLQGYKQKYREAKNMVRKARNAMDQFSDKGRIRNQPLAQRQVGQSLDKDQLAERQQQLKATKDGLKSSVSGTMLVDRRNKEFHEGQDRLGIENAATADREQLMDRHVDKAAIGTKLNVPQNILDVAREKAVDSKNDNVTNIEDFRRKRGNLAELALTDQTNIQDAQREAATSVDRAEMRDVDLVDRSQSLRNVNLRNQHSHEDRINEQQRNINDTVSRHVITNENNERTVNNVIERNNNVTETNRHVQENMTERESVSKDVIKRNEQNVRENVSTIKNVNREQVNETINRENVNTTNRERGNRSER